MVRGSVAVVLASVAAGGHARYFLRHSAAPGFYRHERYVPPTALADWVEHFWVEEWRFDSFAPQTPDVLPHPSVQLVSLRSARASTECNWVASFDSWWARIEFLVPYVGASSRWVIKRYRVYEAPASMEAQAGWAGLAQDLGYFDQAHFTNDFKKFVGCSPGEYVRPLQS